MLGFIIFGTRGIRFTKEKGRFDCPQCEVERDFKHKSVRQFFTLYFLPVIPLWRAGEYVECKSCRNTYFPNILVGNVKTRTQDDVSLERKGRVRVSSPSETGTYTRSSASGGLSESEILSEKQKAIKKVLIMMILADGKIEEEEIKAFHAVYKKTAKAKVKDIYQEIEEVRRENKRPEQYLKQVANYLNPENKQDIIRASMMIAASDGDIDPSEVNMVERFGKALEMRPDTVRQIIDAVVRG